MKPEQRTDIVVKSMFLDLLDSIQLYEASLREKHTEKALHSLRITVRKTRSLLGHSKQVLPANRLSRFKRDFSWMSDFTCGPRDLDVYLISVKKLKSRSGDESEDLDPFIQYLQTKGEQEHQRLNDCLNSARYEKLKQDWREFLKSPVPETSTLDFAMIPVKEFSRRRIWSCYTRVMKQGRGIESHSKDADVHELRKSCKKLRYMIEFFKELYPAKKISQQIKQQKALQDRLGEFQDVCVQEKILKDFIRALDRDIWASVSSRQRMDELLGKLARKKKNMHKKIPEVFARFDSSKNYGLCKKLFKS